jgi:hypothetical protein
MLYNQGYEVAEELPRNFTVRFSEEGVKGKPCVRVEVNNKQVGDVITDNAYEEDFYRYHDVFHYTFATLLGWSPCVRSMMKRKRKSDPILDEVEDGARGAITEEAISLILFSEAKKSNFFKEDEEVSPAILDIIMGMTESFEVKDRTKEEWEEAIRTGYRVFNKLVQNRGGVVKFNADNRTVEYEK